jgi:hypothetical protein
VRRSEAFLTDSPGADGGAFDIDYGDADNVVEDSYGHDTQGYCVAVFGAGQVTTNSVVRRNVCVGNGRSPRLAAAQGAVFLSTWDGGKLKGVQIVENRIFWHPPMAAAAVVNTAEFVDSATFEHNAIETSVPRFDVRLRHPSGRVAAVRLRAEIWRPGGDSFQRLSSVSCGRAGGHPGGAGGRGESAVGLESRRHYRAD